MQMRNVTAWPSALQPLIISQKLSLQSASLAGPSHTATMPHAQCNSVAQFIASPDPAAFDNVSGADQCTRRWRMSNAGVRPRPQLTSTWKDPEG